MVVSGSYITKLLKVHNWVSNYHTKKNNELHAEMKVVNKFGKTLFAMLSGYRYDSL